MCRSPRRTSNIQCIQQPNTDGVVAKAAKWQRRRRRHKQQEQPQQQRPKLVLRRKQKFSSVATNEENWLISTIRSNPHSYSRWCRRNNNLIRNLRKRRKRRRDIANGCGGGLYDEPDDGQEMVGDRYCRFCGQKLPLFSLLSPYRRPPLCSCLHPSGSYQWHLIPSSPCSFPTRNRSASSNENHQEPSNCSCLPFSFAPSLSSSLHSLGGCGNNPNTVSRLLSNKGEELQQAQEFQEHREQQQFLRHLFDSVSRRRQDQKEQPTTTIQPPRWMRFPFSLQLRRRNKHPHVRFNLRKTKYYSEKQPPDDKINNNSNHNTSTPLFCSHPNNKPSFEPGTTEFKDNVVLGEQDNFYDARQEEDDDEEEEHEDKSCLWYSEQELNLMGKAYQRYPNLIQLLEDEITESDEEASDVNNNALDDVDYNTSFTTNDLENSLRGPDSEPFLLTNTSYDDDDDDDLGNKHPRNQHYHCYKRFFLPTTIQGKLLLGVD